MIAREYKFWDRVDGDPTALECWLWTGSKDWKGYGRFTTSPAPCKSWLAHRLAYWLIRGELISGLQMDHLCRNPGCINPFHLEQVTSRENTLRGQGNSAVNAKKTHCIRGHPFSPENTYSRSDGRGCFRCRNEVHNPGRYTKSRAALNPPKGGAVKKGLSKEKE